MINRPRIVVEYDRKGEVRRISKVFLVFPRSLADDVEHWFEVPIIALSRIDEAGDLSKVVLEARWMVTETEIDGP